MLPFIILTFRKPVNIVIGNVEIIVHEKETTTDDSKSKQKSQETNGMSESRFVAFRSERSKYLVIFSSLLTFLVFV